MTGYELVADPAVVKEIVQETPDIKTFVLARHDGHELCALPGQFVEVSLPGYGEATFAIARLSADRKEWSVSVKRVGHLTRMLHRTSIGDTVGIRGPYGNTFPVADWHDKTIHIIGGGIGMAPLRPVIDHIFSSRDMYGPLRIVYGARTPQDIMYQSDLSHWKREPGVSLTTTIDSPHEDWAGRVGLIPRIVSDLKFTPHNGIAVVCGPPVMIKFTVATLHELGWKADAVYTTLEMKMQCGIGQCGRCNIGEKYICRDGPVFRIDQIPDYFEF